MAKGGVTKKIEDAISALDSKQLKKALYLTENNPKLERHHQWIEDAARFCLANREDKNACDNAIKEARDKVHSTVTVPIDDISLEGLEEYLSPQKVKEPEKQKPAEEITDEEAFESCEECHVAVAASRFADICNERPEEAGSCLGANGLIGRSLANEDTEPVDWIKAMVQTAEQAKAKAREEMAAALTELTDYLERRNSPFLKALDEEEKNAETTTVPPHTEEPAD